MLAGLVAGGLTLWAGAHIANAILVGLGAMAAGAGFFNGIIGPADQPCCAEGDGQRGRRVATEYAPMKRSPVRRWNAAARRALLPLGEQPPDTGAVHAF